MSERPCTTQRPAGAPSLYEWRAARPVRPPLDARRPPAELLQSLRWPTAGASVPVLAAFSAPDPKELAADATALAAAAAKSNGESLRRALGVLRRTAQPSRGARLAGVLRMHVEARAAIVALLRECVRRATDPDALGAALACYASLADAPDLAIVDALAGQPDCAAALVEILDVAAAPPDVRSELLLRIAATARDEGRSQAMFALTDFVADARVRRWLVRTDTAGASLAAMAHLARHLDFTAIDALHADEPADVIGWLHLFVRWFEHGLSTTTIRDGQVSRGPPPPIDDIPDGAAHFERLLDRLERIDLGDEAGFEALVEASRLRFNIRLLPAVPRTAADWVTRETARLRWRSRLRDWMARPAHRTIVERVLADPFEPRLLSAVLVSEDAWAEDAWPCLMTALRAGRLSELWATTSRTRTRERMAVLAEWVRGVLAIDADGVRVATPLHYIDQPGVRVGGSAAFDDPRQASAAHQTLRLVLVELESWSGVGMPLVLAALRSKEPALDAIARDVVAAWTQADRDAVLRRLPPAH